MPSIPEIKTAAMIAVATSSLETATANLIASTTASDAAHRAIEVAVRGAGYDSFVVGPTTVSVPSRLRAWTAQGGVSPPQYTDIGLAPLVTSWKAAAATTTRRQNELDGLKYVLAEAKGLAASYPPVDEPDVLPGLQSLLTAIQASMVVP